jgi:hypothetical protein
MMLTESNKGGEANNKRPGQMKTGGLAHRMCVGIMYADLGLDDTTNKICSTYILR